MYLGTKVMGQISELQDEFPEEPHNWRPPAERLSYEAKVRIRAKIRNENAQAWLDELPNILGPEPAMDDADGWFKRRMRLLELAQVEGIGLSVQGVKNYADECARNAAIAKPEKYRDKVDVNVSVTVQALSARLLEGRAQARVIEAPVDKPENPQE